MSILTEDEAELLREVVSRPRAPVEPIGDRVKDYSLIRDQSDSSAAMAALESASADIALAIEQTLCTKTRKAWSVVAREPHKAVIGEFFGTMPNPVLGVWVSRSEQCGFLMMDRVTARTLVLSLLGVETNGTPPAEEPLGAIDRKVIGRLMQALGDQLSGAFKEAGLRAPGDIRLDTDWRKVGPELKAAPAIVVPVDIREPVEARIDVVMTAAFVAPAATAGRAKEATVAEHIPEINLDVIAQLGSLEMTLDALSAIQSGSVLLLGTESTPLTVLIGGEPRFIGKPDVREGRIVMTLTGRTEDTQRPPAGRELLNPPAIDRLRP